MSHKCNNKIASRLLHLHYPEACGYMRGTSTSPEVNPLMEFMYLVFARTPGESYRRRLRSSWLCLCDESYHRRLSSLLLHLCDVFWELINSLVCWFCPGAPGLVLFQILIGQSRDLISDGMWPARSANDTLPSLWINWRPRSFCRGIYDISMTSARGPLVRLEFFGSHLQKYIRYSSSLQSYYWRKREQISHFHSQHDIQSRSITPFTLI